MRLGLGKCCRLGLGKLVATHCGFIASSMSSRRMTSGGQEENRMQSFNTRDCELRGTSASYLPDCYKINEREGRDVQCSQGQMPLNGVAALVLQPAIVDGYLWSRSAQAIEQKGQHVADDDGEGTHARHCAKCRVWTGYF